MCLGSNFSKECLVFVPSVGKPMVDIFWLARDDLILSTDPSDRVYTSEQRSAHLLLISFVLFYLLLFGYNNMTIYNVCMFD